MNHSHSACHIGMAKVEEKTPIREKFYKLAREKVLLRYISIGFLEKYDFMAGCQRIQKLDTTTTSALGG